MSNVSFPGPGRQDSGEPPLPGGPARGEAAGDPGDWGPDDDAEMARYLADLEAGREEVPEPWSSPACTVSLGEACDVDLAELAAMTGPDGLAGEAFTQNRPADAMRPGPVLAAPAERAAEDLDQLADDALLGLVSAARRSRARADYLELAAVAEFTRRREAQFEAAKAARVPRGCRDGEYPDQELAFELVTTAHAASDRMDLAAHLTTRLPDTLAGLAAGTIDADRARVIWFYTRFLSGEDAAAADKILAAAAPGLRADLLARRAARLEAKLDPEGVRRRKDEARQTGRRVEARREASGNSCLAGRELDTGDASAHPRSRWCVTITGPDGTAIAHGCARGQHPWTPEPPQNSPSSGDPPPENGTPTPQPGDPPGPDARQAAQLAELLRRLNVTFRPIAKGTCDHKHQEDRYTPSRALKHLVRARTATCSAPGCGAQAINCDLDHTRAYPAGITCECDLAPLCHHYHRRKSWYLAVAGWRPAFSSAGTSSRAA